MAASVRVPVNASIWDWITRIGSLKGLSPDDQRNIERWRAGETDPTVNQLSQFSRKLRIPFGYFFLNEPIEDTPAVFAHRTIANAAIVKPSRDLIDTISDMQAIQDWVRQDALETGLERLPFLSGWSRHRCDAGAENSSGAGTVFEMVCQEWPVFVCRGCVCNVAWVLRERWCGCDAERHRGRQYSSAA